MRYEKPTIVTLTLAELENTQVIAALQLEDGGCQCQAQCQCQCQCQKSGLRLHVAVACASKKSGCKVHVFVLNVLYTV